MLRLLHSFAMLILGAIFVLVMLLLLVVFLPNILVVDHKPHYADAIVVLGGGGSDRLHLGLQLYEQKIAPRLLLVAGNNKSWEAQLKNLCPDYPSRVQEIVFIEGSTDTHTDAKLSLDYCRNNNLHDIIVVTSPYYTRRAQLVFNDIFEDSSNSATVISSGDYEKHLRPDDAWWGDRKTLEIVWIEFGKILYWELTPFMEFKGDK